MKRLLEISEGTFSYYKNALKAAVVFGLALAVLLALGILPMLAAVELGPWWLLVYLVSVPLMVAFVQWVSEL